MAVNEYTQIDSNHIKGGLYQVGTLRELFDYNPQHHFKDGMLAYVSQEDCYYQYDQDLKKWYKLNIQKESVDRNPDVTIEVNGVEYTVEENQSYQEMLKNLIRIQYSSEDINLIMMSYQMFPSEYEEQYTRLQKWIQDCKAAAKSFYYSTSEVYDPSTWNESEISRLIY